MSINPYTDFINVLFSLLALASDQPGPVILNYDNSLCRSTRADVIKIAAPRVIGYDSTFKQARHSEQWTLVDHMNMEGRNQVSLCKKII